MTQAKICILIAIVFYLGLVLYIGYRCSKKNKNTDDFYLGGRKLGPFVTAMSAEASDMSSYLLMGIPGLAYLSGIADAGWTIIGLAVGTYLNFLIVAKKLRRYSKIADNAITLPQFFKNRYHDSSNALLYIAAIVIVVFFIPYTASGFAACGKLFSSLFGVNYMAAMIVSAIVIVGYTTLGGFLAASTTDLIQSIIMSIALIIVFVFGVNVAGGFGVVMENAKALPGYLTMFATHHAEDGTSSPYGIITIVSTLAWGLGYFGMPHILLRFMAIEDEEKLYISRRVAIIWVTISMAVAVLIGIAGYSMSRIGAVDTLAGADSETIIVKVADLMSQNVGCRCDSCRYHGVYHVYGRLAAACGIVGSIFRPSWRKAENKRQGRNGGSACYFAGYFHFCSDFGKRSEQFGLWHCFVCMGRIRRGVWSGCIIFTVLETYKPLWGACRHGVRRCDDFCMEIPCASIGRRMGYL